MGVVVVVSFEGNVISPKLVGDKVGLHPVWLMFVLLLLRQAPLGFTGLIIAVPVAAAVGVLWGVSGSAISRQRTLYELSRSAWCLSCRIL